MAETLLSKAELIEHQIMRQAAASGIRLRFDKVALRFLDDVKSAISHTLRADQSVAFTIAAPIKLPAKTSAELQAWLRRLSTQELSTTIYGNRVRARPINGTAKNMPKVIGFVHNPNGNVESALDIAELVLREP